MPVCCAPGCSSGYASQPKGGRHFFKPPREDLQAWENALRRADFRLTEKSTVCDLHFDSSQISTHYEHQIGGQTVLIPRGKWLLKKNAIPCLAVSGPFSKRAAQSAAKGGKAFAKRADETSGTSSCSQVEPSSLQASEFQTSETKEDSGGKWLLKKNATPCPGFGGPFSIRTEQSAAKGGTAFAERDDETSETSSCSQAEPPSLQAPGFQTITIKTEEGECDNSATFHLLPSEMEASEYQKSEAEEGGGDNSATFHLLLSQIEASKWLDNWLVDTSVEERIIFAKLARDSDESVSVERAVVLREDLTVTVSSKGRLVPEATYSSFETRSEQTALTLRNMNEVRSFLRYVNSLEVCKGCHASQCPSIETSVTAVRQGDVWYRKNCMVLSESQQCEECTKLQKLLRQREKRKSAQPNTQAEIQSRSDVRSLRRKVLRVTEVCERLKEEVQNLKCQLLSMPQEKNL
ncbi:uncharacterized protein LOC115330318 isoform X1 [Ixodes scapularis]|uniref:uncharacterized protein LOC115330318 isoform X1 n=1 Tax=Ixodes scapularis TaxID=6945 RepID=UPI001A9D4AE9|nr:uncharacterized protein LOC115330318 isoform X1 [Ixodes scapularis]XP_040358644.1 uncharacterized protein LOC115330318 isoform X1 [Ixodes scapularis]XP_042148343.1 uncharacterized protein LOC115330318 isoform X1 [Ixodes scapularis]